MAININSKNVLGEYLKSISDSYSVKDKKQSLSDILKSFSQLSKSQKEIEGEKYADIKYSSYNFNECTLEEKQSFFNDQLQFVETLIVNKIYEKSGIVWNWYDIFRLMLDPTYKNTQKTDRKVIYPTASNSRPIGDTSYSMWNGLQIIDLDIKDEEISNKLKPIIFDELKKYNWFLGLAKSASGKSLHVWTKITPLSTNNDNRRIEYLCNFRHKYSFIYIVLLKYAKELNYTKDDIIKFIDMAMSKPQQGIFVTSDENAMLNTNFKDYRLDVNFETAFNTGISSIDWISHPDLKEIFKKLEWFNNDNTSEQKIEVTNISGINDRDLSKRHGPVHYKHNQRWQLANTLTSLFGQDKALSIMAEICKDTPYGELAGDVKTASIHNKPISIWAVKELNRRHGFNIKVKADENNGEEVNKIVENIENEEDASIDPTKILNDSTKKVIINIKHDQYLSDVKDKIIENLGQITLLEAGAGLGKTEMIKALKAKTLLILPFTSTIKAKVEASETTKDWFYYYGNKRPTLDDILEKDRSMSMTIDKFSKLNVFELEQAKFEYIVIDESHLLFTSSYRDVMSPAIQRLANCNNTKIIMMTGTPTGELLFFPGIKHIKVIKEDFRQKDFEVHMVPTRMEKIIEMSKAMAKDIAEGKKILYPTNKGNLYYREINGLIQQYLNQMGVNKELKSFYYKKSNYGDESMDSINIDKSIGPNDLIVCTTYLSVGVDICDKYKFAVYFSETDIPQNIEQFTNRIRNNDLHIKMYLEMEDSMGFPINYNQVKPLDLSFDQASLLMIRDIMQMANDMLERNEEEAKYNPLIMYVLTVNPFLKYDENDVKYYVDETTYKLRIFEERYSEYSKQLPVLLNGMKYYGYDISTIVHKERILEDHIEQVKEFFKNCRLSKYNEDTVKTFNLLNHINDENIDTYKEILSGNYEIFRTDKYAEDAGTNSLFVEDIEILEKNMPIIVSLYKYYECDTIKDIFEYCLDRNRSRINYTKLGRIKKFVTIEANRRKGRIDFPVMRFIMDCQDWVREKKIVSATDIDVWLAGYAAKYANSIKDVVVEDTKFLETIYDMLKELWKVIIVQSKNSGENIHVTPFELLWDSKIDLYDLYGGKKTTKDFFLQELIKDMKDEIDEDSDVEIVPELEHTSKLTLDDVKDNLQNVVHKEFEYYTYSDLDKSNERFLRKEKINNSLKDAIFDTNKNEETKKNEMNDLFSTENVDDDMPF